MLSTVCRHCGATEQRHDVEWRGNVCPEGFSALRMVYVAGRFSAADRAGVEFNIQRAEAVGVEVARLGAYPMVPHSNTAHPAYELVQPYKFWIIGTAQMMRCCDALITVPGWEESSGASGEVNEMTNMGRPVFHDLTALALWLEMDSGAPAVARDVKRKVEGGK